MAESTPTPVVTPSETPSETPNEISESAEETAADAGNSGISAEKKEVTPPAAKKEEPKSSKKKYKLKVDKVEEDYEFDPSNDEEVIKHLQMSRAGTKRMAEAAEVRNAAMQFIDELKKNPRKVLSDPNIGVDLKKFAEEIINDHIKDLEKSPEQREKEALTAELEKLRKDSKDKEEAAKKSEFEKLQLEQEHQLSTQIEAALDIGGLPKHPRTVKAMAEMMMIALQNDIDLSPQDIAPIIKNNTMGEFKEIVQALSDDQLEDFLGKEILGRLTKKRVAKAKSAQTVNNIQATGSNKKTEKDEPVKKMTVREFLKV